MFVAFQKLRASQFVSLDNLNAAWTSYSPSWSCATTPPALGNGTLAGRWRQIGDKMIMCEITLTAGTTTTFGTGFWQFTLPVNASAASILSSVGTAQLLDAGTARRSGSCNIESATLVDPISPTGSVSNTVPHTWATTDVCAISIIYERA